MLLSESSGWGYTPKAHLRCVPLARSFTKPALVVGFSSLTVLTLEKRWAYRCVYVSYSTVVIGRS